ncbi:TRAP transporter large permease subunit [Paracoccaceae bacterium]|nr:TRAP transporter large permease subunit [Paracoccaceae bacterium]
MPIGFVIGAAGVVGLISLGGTSFLAISPSRIFAGLDLFPFLAMPFFILAGEIMNAVGITQRLVSFAQALVGRFRGGVGSLKYACLCIFCWFDRVGNGRCSSIWPNISSRNG